MQLKRYWNKEGANERSEKVVPNLRQRSSAQCPFLAFVDDLLCTVKASVRASTGPANGSPAVAEQKAHFGV